MPVQAEVLGEVREDQPAFATGFEVCGQPGEERAGSEDAGEDPLLVDAQQRDHAAVVGGGATTPGAALIEIYDVENTIAPTARITNISTRGQIVAGDSIIAGFTLTGDLRKRLLIRAVGPTLGTFGVILLLAREGFEAEEIADLRGLNRRSPWYAFLTLLFMFSLAGIPPLSGFWGKLVLVKAGLESGRYHFYLYGHADADVTGEQNSGFTLRAGTNTFGPVTQLGGSGWKAGVDGSVVLVDLGAGKSIDSSRIGCC